MNKTGSGRLAMPNTLYDVAKDTALIYLPAAGTLYFALATIWGLPAPQQVVGTVTAVVTFMGIVLRISKSSYDNSDKSNDGRLVIDQSDPRADKYALEVSTPLEEVADANKITLKVENTTPAPTPVPAVDPQSVKGASQ